MLKTMRQNPMIAAGILLPLVIVVFFVLATAIPKWLVDPPAHDFLFTVPENRSSSPEIELRFDVANNRLRVRLFKTKAVYGTVPRLYLFDHETLNVREILIDLPNDPEAFENGDEIDVAEFVHRQISAERKAPDGYEIRQPRYRNDNLMTALFGSSRRYRLAIHKSGAVIDVPHPDNNAYYYYNVNFLGWLTDEVS
jgi:hypothetical protein